MRRDKAKLASPSLGRERDLSGGSALNVAFDGSVSAPAPERSSWLMMMLGFAGVSLIGWRKRAMISTRRH
jgi:hypothetical protein